jgi:hypothetical protein
LVYGRPNPYYFTHLGCGDILFALAEIIWVATTTPPKEGI